jgi:hypothetical protein
MQSCGDRSLAEYSPRATLLGCPNLAADAAEKWWMLWCRVLDEHNRQQWRSVRILQDARLPAGYALTSFMGGVEAYLNDAPKPSGALRSLSASFHSQRN